MPLAYYEMKEGGLAWKFRYDPLWESYLGYAYEYSKTIGKIWW